jgi:hypothetical protein
VLVGVIVVVALVALIIFLNLQDAHREDPDAVIALQEKDAEIVRLERELAATREDLANQVAETEEAEQDIEGLLNASKKTKQIRDEIQEELEKQIEDCQASKESLEIQLQHEQGFRDITYDELVQFLKADKTDEKRFDEKSYPPYNALDFSLDLKRNAEKENIYSQLVALSYESCRYDFINAFRTTDEGVVLVSPQNDDIVTAEFGESFRKQNGYRLIFEDIILQVYFLR